MGEATSYYTNSTTTLPADPEKSQPLAQATPVCNHQASASQTAYPNLTQLLQAPSSRKQIQSLITNLQRILDDDKCTACAVEDGVKSMTAGVLEAKKAKKQYKKTGQSIQGWNKETVWGAKKEMKGLVKGVKAEWKRAEKGE